MWTVIEHQSAPDSDGEFDFTGLDFSSYKRLRLSLDGVVPTNDGIFSELQFYIASSLVTSGYRYDVRAWSTSASFSDKNSASATEILLQGGANTDWGVGNAAGKSFKGLVDISNMESGLYKLCHSHMFGVGPSGNGIGHFGGGILEDTGEMDGLVVRPDAGTFDSGLATLYGWPIA